MSGYMSAVVSVWLGAGLQVDQCWGRGMLQIGMLHRPKIFFADSLPAGACVLISAATKKEWIMIL